MKVSTKLYGSVGVQAATGMLAAGAAIWCLRTLGEELNIATGKTAVKPGLVDTADAGAREMVAALRGMFPFAGIRNQAELDACALRPEAAFKRVDEAITGLGPLLVTEEGRRGLDKLESTMGEFQKVSADYVRLCRESRFEQLAADIVPKVTTLNSGESGEPVLAAPKAPKVAFPLEEHFRES